MSMTPESAIVCVKMMFAFWANAHGLNVAEMEEAKDLAVEALRAYPPAHIDRESWKCPLCETSEVISFEAWEDESKFPKGPSVRGSALFCPFCGKPRTPDAWAELEKRLRG